MSISEKQIPILELDKVSFEKSEMRRTINLTLQPGELAFIKHQTIAEFLTGIVTPVSGEIRFCGKAWANFGVTDLENSRSQIGTVFSRRARHIASWIYNINVADNIVLAADFNKNRSSSEIRNKANELAKSFGFADGLPRQRPANLSVSDSIRCQWIRAFLPDPLKLLILESPTMHAPAADVPALVEATKEAQKNGAAVVWVEESDPPFSILDIDPDFLI